MHGTLLFDILPTLFSNNFTPPLGRVKTPQLRDDTPPTRSHFVLFLMFFNVNLRFVHVYTPPREGKDPPVSNS